MLVAVAMAGLGFDLGVRTGVSSLAATLAVLATVAALAAAGVRSRLSLVFLAGACVFALLLPLRASTWLTALNSVAIATALGLAVLVHGAVNRSWSVATVATAIVRAFSGLYGPVLIARSVRPRSGPMSARWRPVVRGALLAVIPVVVLGALLASADVVFAALFTPDVELGPVTGHVVLFVCGAVGVAALIAVATSDGSATIGDDVRPLGATEASIVLGSVATLFAGFAAVQLYSALGQADDLLAAEGVTAADYARSGYFQLLWVAALTAVLLAGIHLVVEVGTGRARALLPLLNASVAVLTCVIVVVAIVRLDLYTDAFGQTSLRWYSDAFAWMLGAAFVLIAVAEVFHLTRLLPAALTSLTAVTLLVVNLLNADARIAEHNLARVDDGYELDAEYLFELSADAWPVLLDHRTMLTGGDELLEDRLERRCIDADEGFGYGVFGLNVARARLDCAA